MLSPQIDDKQCVCVCVCVMLEDKYRDSMS